MRLWREHGSRRFPPRTSAPCFVTAWVYLPEGSGPHPAVVMAHGIGGIKAGGLAPFAERFREEGCSTAQSMTVL
jgi:dienelactone hydrolase